MFWSDKGSVIWLDIFIVTRAHAHTHARRHARTHIHTYTHTHTRAHIHTHTITNIHVTCKYTMVNIHTHKHLRDLRTLNSPCQVKIIVTMGLIGCFLLR